VRASEERAGEAELPGIRRVGQVAIPIKDLGRAVEFYRDRLGLELLFKIPNAAFFMCGDVRLMLAIPESAEFDHPASTLYLDVPEIGAAYETLVARGVAFRGEPHMIARMPDHELWMAFFDDSEGNVMALMSEVR
jgi:methylmalonyl-CoA/ethylmalonyl-CoA epimerase